MHASGTQFLASLNMTRGNQHVGGVNDYQAAASSLKFPARVSDGLNFSCSFTVPPKPVSWDGKTQVYLWCGLNWYDAGGNCLGVMQPVLTYGCSPDAMSGVGCGTTTSDPHYSSDPYWYFSSQYVLGWGPGQARGSSQVVKTLPGRTIYSEMSYDASADAWLIRGREETTKEISDYVVRHPVEDPGRSWRTEHASPETSATAYVVSEPHQA